MSDQVQAYVVTGGNTGLGFECARALAALPGATVVVACRDVKKGRAAVGQIHAEGGRAIVMELDLSSLASVRKFAADFRRSGLPGLNGLVCNAGIQEIGAPSKTSEGFESTFGVNHLAHFLLAQLLLPVLARAARIVFVSSGTHDPKEKSGLPAPRYASGRQVAEDFEPGRTAGLRRYTTSKLCNVYCAYRFAEWLAASGDARLRTVRVNAFDPGMMPGTNLARQYPATLRWIWTYVMPVLILFMRNAHTTRKSGERLAQLVSDPENHVTGKYFSNGREAPSSELSYDRKNAEELWRSSLEMTGLSTK